jgi:DNA-binding IclR family transcriptional regulator
MHFLLSDEHESGTVTLHVSLSRLADMLDMGRASLYRALDALSDSKIISKDAKTVKVLDRNALRRVADGELKL